MNVRLVAIIGVVCFVVGAGAGVLGYTWFVGGDGEASAPISAPTLDVNALPTLNPTQAFAAITEIAELNGEVANLQATVEALSVTQQATPTAFLTEASTPTEEAALLTEQAIATEEPVANSEQTSTERKLFRIDNANSQVSFTLQEDLRGVRTEVVGKTTEVAGDIVVDFANPSASQIGTIRINARTLATDSENRNRALRAEILLSAQAEYEFIEFAPTALNGLPANINVGETYPVEIVGNLTIIGVTQEITFSADITIQSETTLTGLASATVQYQAWGISIPDVPMVANVTDDVTLTIEFTANQVEQ